MDTVNSLNTLQLNLDNYLALNKTEQKKIFSKMKIICEDLRKYAKEKNINYGYTSEKLNYFIWSIGAIAGVDDDNGHSQEQHYIWALGVLGSLGSSLCFGAK